MLPSIKSTDCRAFGNSDMVDSRIVEPEVRKCILRACMSSISSQQLQPGLCQSPLFGRINNRYILVCSLKEVCKGHGMSCGWEDSSAYWNDQNRNCFQDKLNCHVAFLSLCFAITLYSYWRQIEVGKTKPIPAFAPKSIILDFGVLSSPKIKPVTETRFRNNMQCTTIFYDVMYI